MMRKVASAAFIAALLSSSALAQPVPPAGGGGGGGGGGSGDVTGPGSSTDGDIALFSGTTGKVLQDPGYGPNLTIAGSSVNLGGSITASTILDSIGSTRGTVLYRGASGWSVLSPGTSGNFLKTNGAGADPTWAAPSGSGTVTNVATGNGLCGGPITTTGTLSTCVLQNAQTGTSYATLSTDGGKLVSLSNASPVAVSLSQANQTGFTAGFGTDYSNLGAGLVTVTAATSVFDNGLTTLTVAKGQDAYVWSDGTNYHSMLTLPTMPADTLLGNFSGTAGQYPVASGAISSCSSASSALTYNTSTHAFGCNTISGSGSPGGSTTQIQANNAGSFGGISTLTVDLTNGYLTESAASAASNSAVLISGSVTTGGTGTTNVPHMLFQAGGTSAVTTWSTAGTFIGMNAPTGFTGNFLDFRLAGSSTVAASIDRVGNLTIQSGLTAGGNAIIGATGILSFNGRGRFTSPADGSFNFNTSANATNTNISNAGIKFLGTAPTPTGTGTPTIATGSTDTSGEVTAGASATSVVITFSAAKTNAPFCVVTSQTQLAAFSYSVSTTAITITQTATSGNKIDYHCTQN